MSYPAFSFLLYIGLPKVSIPSSIFFRLPFFYSSAWPAMHLFKVMMPAARRLKPGFHSNAIACVACVAYTKTARNASACVGKQPIMAATASTEHSYWLALALRENFRQTFAFLAVFVYAIERLRLNGNRATTVRPVLCSCRTTSMEFVAISSKRYSRAA